MFAFLVFEKIVRKLATAPLSHISDELVIHREILTRFISARLNGPHHKRYISRAMGKPVLIVTSAPIPS